MPLTPASSGGVDLATANAWTANQTAPAWVASGLTGATAASRYVGATTSGAPVSGTFAVGDYTIDRAGSIWICTAAGSPGTWSSAGGVSAATLASAVGGVVWTNVVKAIDESVASSATLQTDDELFFTAVSGATYEVESLTIYASPAGGATPDMKIAFGEDASVRGNMIVSIISTGDITNLGSQLTNQTLLASVGTAAANRAVYASGFHTGGGGTFSLLWAQSTSGVNATIVRAGSVLRYRRIL